MKTNTELRGALNMVLARLDTDPKTSGEWNTIQIALSEALGYSVKVIEETYVEPYHGHHYEREDLARGT